MFPSGNAHRRNHHQLDAVRLVVHLACGKGLYLIQEIFFIVFCYGVFATSELHLTEIVRPVSLAFQQQVNLSPPSVGTFPAPTIIPVDGGYTQGVLNLGQVFHTKQFKSVSCPCVENGSAVNGIPYSFLCLFALLKNQRKRENIFEFR